MVRSRQTQPKIAPALPPQPLLVPEKLWKTEDVMEFLGVGEDMVRWLREKEGLPHLRWRDTVRYYPAGVIHWAEQQQQTA